MRGRRAFLLVLASAPAALVRVGEAVAAPAYVIVVHPANPATVLPRKFVAEAFLKKTTRWDHGEVIRPVDQVADSPARRKFSEDVLKRSVAAVRSYWQQLIFAGRDVPPPELRSDEEVVKFVLKYPGAVGYVSGTADVGGAKIVSVE
jgi:ABC-type phosphate transport system substrate-binding protein